MSIECETINHLRHIADAAMAEDSALVLTAASALNIIKDIKEYSMTDTDVHYLHELVDALFQSGHGDLLRHLQSGSADCRICAAVQSRMRARSLSPGG